MIRKFIASTRFLMLIPAAGTLIASLAVLIFGGSETLRAVMGTMDGTLLAKGTKTVLLKYIEIIDLFLIGTVFYITALGLYELFIDDQVITPAWLHITHLDDLKAKLLSVVVVILVVVFLGQVINWEAGWEILGLGAGIGMVILAVTYFLRRGGSNQ